MYITIDHRSELNVKQDDLLASKRYVIERKPDMVYFYELEEAIVLDVILDENHPEFKNGNLDTNTWPPNIDGSAPVLGGPNYSYIGRIRFRFLKSQINQDKETLNWAFPMESTGIIEYPLMNEVVVVGKYMGEYYYTRKLNSTSIKNTAANFITERIAGRVDENINTYSANKKYIGPVSRMVVGQNGNKNFEGVLGNYFKYNHHIRSLKHYEGDTILESRFGSSIRFSAYDDVRGNDGGLGEYSDGGGNPMILIRNRQSPIKNSQGYTGKGYTLEDINNDGSSIHFTSGKTVSKFNTTVELPIYSGKTGTRLPKLDGDQIIINSDRLIFSSKANEMLFLSKKRMCMTTDSEISFSSQKRMTLTSLASITLNSPVLFVGEHANISEPALLGRTTVAWLYSMTDWMLINVNSQIIILQQLLSHKHLAKGTPSSPPLPPAIAIWTTQLAALKASQLSLLQLQQQLNSLMSNRVFIV